MTALYPKASWKGVKERQISSQESDKVRNLLLAVEGILTKGTLMESHFNRKFGE